MTNSRTRTERFTILRSMLFIATAVVLGSLARAADEPVAFGEASQFPPRVERLK